MNAVKDSINSCLWGSSSSPLSPQETVMKYFKEQEELKCDPLYLAVKLGIIHLLYLKMVKQHKEEAIRAAQMGIPIPPLQSIKISFKEDCSLHIAEPGFFSQSLARKWSGEGRGELGYIRPHLVKLLRWFNYQDDTYKTILNVCKCGIEAILNGYKYQQNLEFIITQSENQKPEEQAIAKTFKIQAHTPETDLVIRILENDIAFLEEATKVKDDRQAKEFTEKLAQEEVKYFPLYQLKLMKVAKTIDAYMAEQVKSRWDDETLQGIVRLFKAESKEAFNHYQSLSSLVSRNPEAHAALKTDIRDLLASTLIQCNLKLQNIERKEELKN